MLQHAKNGCKNAIGIRIGAHACADHWNFMLIWRHALRSSVCVFFFRSSWCPNCGVCRVQEMSTVGLFTSMILSFCGERNENRLHCNYMQWSVIKSLNMRLFSPRPAAKQRRNQPVMKPSFLCALFFDESHGKTKEKREKKIIREKYYKRIYRQLVWPRRVQEHQCHATRCQCLQ